MMITRKVSDSRKILSRSTLLIESTLKKLGIVLPISVEMGGILKSLFSLPKAELIVC